MVRLHGGQRLQRGILLGRPATASGSRRNDRQFRDAALDGKLLRVRLARRADDGVLGHRQPLRLQPFLQSSLRILAERRRIGIAQQVGIDGVDRPARGRETGIDEHGAEHRLHRVREDRRPIRAPASRFAFAKVDRSAEPEPPGHMRQRVLVDEMRAGAGQVALGKRREPLVERQRDDAVEDRVADEFQPFVVRDAVASVR